MPALSSHAVFVALVAICLGIVWIANPRGGVSPSSPDAGLPAQIQPEVRTASLAEPDDPVCAASACLRALAPSGGAVHMPAVHAACGEAIEDVGAASSGRNGHNGRSNGRNNGQSSCAAADEAEAALRLWAKGLRSLALQWMRRAVAHAQAEAEGASAAEEAQSQPSDTTDVQQMHDEAIENHKHPGKTTEGKPLKSNAQQDKTGAIDTQDTGGTTAPPQVSKGEAVARMESTAAKMALQMGYGEEAALLVSAALARRLRLAGPDAVAPTLMQSAGRAPEDLAWLAEAEAAQPAVAQDLDTLLSAALLTHALPLANALHLVGEKEKAKAKWTAGVWTPSFHWL